MPRSGVTDKMSDRVLHNSFSHCFRHTSVLVAHSWIRQLALGTEIEQWSREKNLRFTFHCSSYTYTTPVSVLEMKLWEVMSVHTVCAFIHANNSALIRLKE